MTTTRCALAASIALAMGVCVGCEKSSKNKTIVLAPTTRQSAPIVNPVTQPDHAKPSTTQAAKRSSYMTINGLVVEFPEPKLIIKREGDRLVAFLGSNDPPEVIQPTYQGNRYYFELALDNVDDVKNIAQADFRYKAASAEPADTPNGIFLDGDRQHLTPYDISVAFDRVDDKIIALIQGQFLYFPKATLVGQMVRVDATLAAKADVK